MTETSEEIINQTLAAQKAFFSTGKTKDINFRLIQLKKLKQTVIQYQAKIEKALWEDLHKSPEEAYITEINIVLNEIGNHIKHLKNWAKPRKVATPIHLLPASGKIIFEPLGVALIVAPWNYPFQLLLNPLIGAISSGCCCILKPSPDAQHTALVMEEMIGQIFNSNYVKVIQGGRDTNTILFSQHFDIIFFTGSSAVGKVVMKAAAENLTPVILELGGKSPCIVDADANIDIAAKRITWGKLINAGQTCIAPDYIFAHHSIKEKLLEKIAFNIKAMYGDPIKQSRFYPRIVNGQAFERLAGLLNQGAIHAGGDLDAQHLYFSPTILDDVKPDFLIMQQEIFGPIFPILTFNHIDETINYINKNKKPLALYYFGSTKKAKSVLNKTSSGGVCINDTLIHIGNDNLPFGGVGNSGMGRYHGHESFLSFSNKRSVVSSPTWLDIPLRYIPFKHFKLTRKII
ncbi:MAG: aldehyde dehydrogenase [Bacteroidetes bacterium]|nr:aldehyde dehydrogenase [Bacteroidota bacterium]